MTRVILNGTVKGYRGKIGNLIFRQLPDGSTVMSQAQPKKNSRQKKRAKLKRSPAQQEHNRRFQDAVFYARVAAKTDPIYAELAAVTPMWNAYNHALHDWFHAPQIGCIARQEGRILVDASDDVRVTKVQVSLLDGENRLLETGEAVRGEDGWWEFASQTEGKTIVAEAWDLPGNVTKLVLNSPKSDTRILVGNKNFDVAFGGGAEGGGGQECAK